MKGFILQVLNGENKILFNVAHFSFNKQYQAVISIPME